MSPRLREPTATRSTAENNSVSNNSHLRGTSSRTVGSPHALRDLQVLHGPCPAAIARGATRGIR
eukprot:3405338-Lingulodinium_polyedra.AAC.1